MITHERIRNDANALYYSKDEKVRKVAYDTIYEYSLQQQTQSTDYEQLQRDVKRYFELENKHCNLDEIDEYTDLLIKLSKVGKGE